MAMKNYLIITIFALVVILSFLFAQGYCGIETVTLTNTTPITIIAYECTEPDVFPEIWNTSRLVADVDDPDGRSCEGSDLKCCAKVWSSNSNHVNLTIMWYNATGDIVELNTHTTEIELDSSGYGYTCSPYEVTNPNRGEEYICSAQSSYSSIDGTFNSSWKNVSADVVYCPNGDECYLRISVLSWSCNATGAREDWTATWIIKVEDDEGHGESGVNIYVNDSLVSGTTGSNGNISFSTPLYTGTYNFKASKSGCHDDEEDYTINEENIINQCDPCEEKEIDFEIYYPCFEVNCSSYTTEGDCTSLGCYWDEDEDSCESLGWSTGVCFDYVTIKFTVFENGTDIPIENVSVFFSHPEYGSSHTGSGCVTNASGECIMEVPHIPNSEFGGPPPGIGDSGGGVVFEDPFNVTLNYPGCEYRDRMGIFYNNCSPCVLRCSVADDPCYYDRHCDGELRSGCCCPGLYCHPDDGSNLSNICVSCFEENVTCTNSSECCSGLCFEGKCVPCLSFGSACMEGGDLRCCDPYDCINGTCTTEEIIEDRRNETEDREDEDEDEEGVIPGSLDEFVEWILGDYDMIVGSPEDIKDPTFVNFDLKLRSGCTGLFLIIGNWIFCDLLWLVLIILSLIAAYRYRKYELGKKASLAVFIIPIAVGFFTYVWIGIVVAILEILNNLVNPPEKGENRGK